MAPKVLRCRHRHALGGGGMSVRCGISGLTLVLTWLIAGRGVASMRGRGQTKGLVARETTGALILLHAFLKGSEVKRLKGILEKL